MEKRKVIVGLDIGGTKTECCLFELDSNSEGESYCIPHKSFRSISILQKKRIATDSSEGIKTFVSNVTELIYEVCAENDVSFDDEVLAIGVGMPGSIDPHTHVMHNGNTEMFIGHNFGELLNMSFSKTKKVTIYNDANCFAIAESFSGAGHSHVQKYGGDEKGYNSVGVILGTGVGGGVVLMGNCLVGNRGGAGELGHTLFVKDGLSCYCGSKGCVERYLSGTAIESFYYDLTGEQISGAEIFKRAESNEANALRIIEDYKDNLSLFLLNLSNIFDLDYVVLGGGVSQQELIYEGLEERINAQKFIKTGKMKVYKHQISDSAGGMGAAIFALFEL